MAYPSKQTHMTRKKIRRIWWNRKICLNNLVLHQVWLSHELNFLFNENNIEDIRPIFVQVQERHSTSPICFNLTSSLYSSPIDIVANVISSKLSADNPAMSDDDRVKIIREYKTRYWLQAFGCEERLFGSKPILQSKVRQIHDCTFACWDHDLFF